MLIEKEKNSQSELDNDLRKRELGQFFTPDSIAIFMASLFQGQFRSINLLDAGAGSGRLSLALVRKYCAAQHKPQSINVTAFEIDPEVISDLNATMAQCKELCAASEIEFEAVIRNEDFITAVIPTVRGELFAPTLKGFNAAIVNPPYKKIRSDSAFRSLLRSAGIETTNLYTGFLSLIIRLMDPLGELVAITPRSFCNGPYFKPFRDELLETLSLRRLHVFESRSEVFKDSSVLQESIVFHAVKSPLPPERVIVSTSSGRSEDVISERTLPFSEVVSPEDPQKFIHLATSANDSDVRKAVGELSTTLKELGLSVSTGRVVDFRAKAFLRQDPEENTVPLIYPCHFNGEFIAWPKSGRKPNAILNTPDTTDLLVPTGVYVLVKRFTSKEERRRIVACIFDPSKVPGTRIGFENHLNYFHVDGHGMNLEIARGLSAFLNSAMVDTYFRQFNGHTQVNATDLRSLNYPTETQIRLLGKIADCTKPDDTLRKLLTQSNDSVQSTPKEHPKAAA